MYRIFCESYKNFLNSFEDYNARLSITKPIELLTNKCEYEKEEQKQSENYKKVADLLYYMEKNISRFPKLKAFLWTLDSRNMKGKEYNVANKEELEEQTKLVNSFLKLAYWY